MKRLIALCFVIILLLYIPFSFSEGTTAIVNNNGGAGQAEDTLCVTFFVTDTVGNFTTADSFYVMIFNPWGDSVYTASYITSAPEIKVVTIGGRKMYRWMEDVADIDGPSPRSGTYAGIILAVDTLDGSSSARLDQAFTFSFILEPTFAERVKIGDTACDGKQVNLVDGAITSAKLANNAITSSKIAPNSISSDEINIDAWVDCWNSPTRTLTSGSNGGSGLYSYDLVVIDSSNSQVIPGVDIAIRNINQTALMGVGRTNIVGTASFNLDQSTYLAIASATGYTFKPYDSISVTGSGQDTLFGYRFDPGEPASPSLCRVYGNIYSIGAVPEEGAMISAILPSGAVRAGNMVVSPFAISTSTDSAGYFALDLIPSDSLIPSGTKYEITITRRDGTILRQRLKVPATPSWRLTW